MNNGYAILGNASAMRIDDRPKYQWRGIMLDPARHFLSVAELCKQIDAMAQNKLNALHLHLTDGESFTVNTDSWPTYSNLSRAGAYHPSLSYTPADLQAVVAHGRLRGVRLIPEFDLPAHMASWAQGYPALLTDCPAVNPHPEWPRYYSPADVTNPLLYSVLQEVIKQAGPLFPDPFWHVGGDEPHYACWAANGNVSSYMRQHGLTTEQLYAQFEGKYAAALAAAGKSTVGWAEIATNTGGGSGPDPASTVIEVWQGNAALAGFVKRG
jgi:hexosaminidase